MDMRIKPEAGAPGACVEVGTFEISGVCVGTAMLVGIIFWVDVDFMVGMRAWVGVLALATVGVRVWIRSRVCKMLLNKMQTMQRTIAATAAARQP